MRVAMILKTACLALAACQPSGETAEDQTTNAPTADIIALAALMENVFETLPDNTENIIRDKRVRVTSDALDGVWFYTQLNTGAEGKLYRQRVSELKLSVDGKDVIQKAYGLKDPAKYADAWNSPELLSALTLDDFDPYFTTGCEQVWTPQAGGAWTGYVNPQTCVITSKRRNKDIRIESEGYLSEDVYRTNERGYDIDMTFLWGTLPGETIALYPVN